MNGGWRPLSVRRGPPPEHRVYDGPHEGVPDWLQASLIAWIAGHFRPAVYQPDFDFNYGLLKKIERNLRILLDWNDDRKLPKSLLLALENDEEFVLDVVDFLVSDGEELMGALFELEEILSQGGSAWRVDWEKAPPGLERRLSDEVEALGREVRSGSSPASAHMRDGWGEAFGRNPHESAAFDSAVQALEAALQPIVLANDGSATLGKIIGEIEKDTSRFQTRLQRAGKPGSDPATADPVLAFVGMLKLVWHSQLDRHGSSNPASPTSVSLAEARDAVVLAAVVVHLTTSGGFCRR